jgi:hypothetical protein
MAMGSMESTYMENKETCVLPFCPMGLGFQNVGSSIS